MESKSEEKSSWNMATIRIPVGTIFIHQRMDTLFPLGQQYPNFIYNWYSQKEGFWTNNSSEVATYTYETKQDISNLIDKNQFQEEEELTRTFSKLWPTYECKEGEVNDYAWAAFAIQVLGFNGIYSKKEGVLILAGSHCDEHYFKLMSCDHTPGMTNHSGYKYATIPEGYGTPDGLVGCLSYSSEQITIIQKSISMIKP